MPKSSMFDLFPNELLYEVFEYLTTYEILYAFQGLNKRIDILLVTYNKYDLNFKSWPKYKFDFVCQSIWPEQIRSLTLSDADDTSQEIHLFFELFDIQQIVNIESLKLIKITEQDLNKVITKFNFLSKLSYLSIKLENCLIPQIEVASLKYLSIGICSISQLQQLLLCTPVLTNLNVQLIYDTNYTRDTFLSTILTTEIRQLKIELAKKSNIEFDHIKILFEWMPQLNKFIFITEKGIKFIDGERWEHLIRTYLSKLKEFYFKIHSYLDSTNIQQLLSTFRTPFWLKEKQWLINCDYHYLSHMGYRAIKNVHLYTLPYCDDQFYLSLSTLGLTNVCKDKYSTIKNLYLSVDSHYNNKIMEHYYFPNIDSLTISNLLRLIPINNLINLSQIKHLTIKENNTISSEDFLSLILLHSTKLQSLKLSWYTLVEITKNFTNQQVCLLLNKQIKYLNLLNMIPDDEKNNQKPIQILNEIFSANLEKLSLILSTIDNIPLVLNEMSKLYSVKIECNPFNTTINDEQISLWLMRNVPRLKILRVGSN